MGFADKVKSVLGGNAGKAKDLLVKHEKQASSGIDKGADVADRKTGGTYSDKIDEGADKAKDALSKLDDDGPEAPPAPPAPPAPLP